MTAVNIGSILRLLQAEEATILSLLRSAVKAWFSMNDSEVVLKTSKLLRF